MSITSILGGGGYSPQPAPQNNELDPQSPSNEEPTQTSQTPPAAGGASGSTAQSGSGASADNQSSNAAQSPNVAPSTDARLAASVVSADLIDNVKSPQASLTVRSTAADDAALQDARAQAEMTQRTLMMQRVIDSVQPLNSGPIGVGVSTDPLAADNTTKLKVAVPDAIPDRLPAGSAG